MTKLISAADLTDEESAKFAGVLLTWFPWLVTEESISGADTIEQLSSLFYVVGGEGNEEEELPQ